jgi:hypothetical protein
LADLFKVKAPASLDEGQSLEGEERPSAAGPVHNQAGRGRVVYLPEVKAAIKKPTAVPMASRFWKLPLNCTDLIESVRWAADGDLAMEVKAPLTVTVELLRQKETGARLLHLLNYDNRANPVVKKIEVRLSVRSFGKVGQVSLQSPDHDGVVSLPLTVSGEHNVFTVSSLETYALVVVS